MDFLRHYLGGKSPRKDKDDSGGEDDGSDDDDANGNDDDSGNDMLALLMSSAVSDDESGSGSGGDSDSDADPNESRGVEASKPQRSNGGAAAAAAPSKPPAAPPVDLVCPLTGQPFNDPVVASDGYTYERKAIEKWLADGNGVSPKSNRPMESLTLYDNVVVKDLLRGAVAAPAAAPATAPSRSAAAPAAPRARPVPRKAAASREDDLDSIYMTRRPSAKGRAARPVRRASAPAQPSDSTGDIDEGAFMQMLQGGRGPPPPSQRGAAEEGEAEEGQGAPAERAAPRTRKPSQGKEKKRNWIFGKKK